MRAVGVSLGVLEPGLPASSGLLITLFTLCYRLFSIVWDLVVLGFLLGLWRLRACFPSQYTSLHFAFFTVSFRS